jgi:Zn-dependent M28 family amino/carboxypeptidase
LGDFGFEVKVNSVEFMKKIFFLLLITTVATACFGQTGADKPASNEIAKIDSRLINAKQLLLDVKTLSADEMQGRGVGTAGGAKAREFVVSRFKESNLSAFGNSYLHPFEFTNRKNEKISGTNIVGFIAGKKKSEKYIVVSAHYDHIGIQNGEIYNGADDDASGVSALFALANYFKKNRPTRSIIFVAFDGEESGLRGSRAFVATPPVAKNLILLNVNMDMVSRSDKNELYAAGTFHYPAFKPIIEKTAKTAKVKLLTGHDRPEQKSDDWTSQSDHFAFHEAKIPFIYFGVEDHKDYHKPTDDFVNINQQFYVHAVETILEAVKVFDKKLK